MTKPESPFKSFQVERWVFETTIGAIEWRPDWEVIEEHLLKPLQEAAEAADAASAHNEAMSIVNSYFSYFFTDNMQFAAVQAVEELVALAKAKASRDKHEREQIAQSAAETARQASLHRLRFTHYFPKPKRGDKKIPLAAQLMQSMIDERELFRIKLEDAVRTLLASGSPTTLENVADVMRIGRGEAGRITLGRQLRQWIDPQQTPAKIIAAMVDRLKA
jgi:hypothetical protein